MIRRMSPAVSRETNRDHSAWAAIHPQHGLVVLHGFSLEPQPIRLAARLRAKHCRHAVGDDTGDNHCADELNDTRTSCHGHISEFLSRATGVVIDQPIVAHVRVRIQRPSGATPY